MNTRALVRFAVSASVVGISTVTALGPATAAVPHAADEQPRVPVVLRGVQVPSARGAKPVGQAAYPVPSGAVFVDAAAGSDSAPGTLDRPLRTAQAGIRKAPRGGTVVLRGGEYRESLFIGKPVTVQAYPNEAVWFDGSEPVTGWSRSGATWVAPWATFFDHSASYSKGYDDPIGFVSPKAPMAAWPDMVLVDGRQLQQVDARSSAVGPGQFAVDERNRTLTIGTDPSGREVRAGKLEKAIVVGSPDVTLQGFGVRRYSNSLPTMGAVFLARARNLVRDVVIEDIATNGISLYSDGSTGSGTVDSVTVRRAGISAIGGQFADGAVIRNSVIEDANWERFNSAPSAAAIKITRSRDVTVDNNRIVRTYGANGIWFDESVVGFRATRNYVTGGGEAGIDAELSAGGVIASNHVTGHKYGIFIYNTENTKVVANTLGYNSVSDLYLMQDERRQASPNAVGRDPRAPRNDPDNTWILRDIDIRANVLGPEGSAKSAFQLFVSDVATGRAADDMNITLVGNAFREKATDNDAMPIGWGRRDRTVAQYRTPAEFSRATNRPSNNLLLPASLGFGAFVEHARFSRLAPSLPADVAGAIGAPRGMRVIGAVTG